jgi:adenylyl-sulfate kinase
VRRGVTRDLGFSNDDRKENIRRVAEVAHMMNEAGVIVLATFISPDIKDRDMARRIIGNEHFIEIYLSTALAICEERDSKGLYRQARAGKLSNFTGIDSTYDVPNNPALSINSGNTSIEESVQKVLGLLEFI